MSNGGEQDVDLFLRGDEILGMFRPLQAEAQTVESLDDCAFCGALPSVHDKPLLRNTMRQCAICGTHVKKTVDVARETVQTASAGNPPAAQVVFVVDHGFDFARAAMRSVVESAPEGSTFSALLFVGPKLRMVDFPPDGGFKTTDLKVLLLKYEDFGWTNAARFLAFLDEYRDPCYCVNFEESQLLVAALRLLSRVHWVKMFRLQHLVFLLHTPSHDIRRWAGKTAYYNGNRIEHEFEFRFPHRAYPCMMEFLGHSQRLGAFFVSVFWEEPAAGVANVLQDLVLQTGGSYSMLPDGNPAQEMWDPRQVCGSLQVYSAEASVTQVGQSSLDRRRWGPESSTFFCVQRRWGPESSTFFCVQLHKHVREAVVQMKIQYTGQDGLRGTRVKTFVVSLSRCLPCPPDVARRLEFEAVEPEQRVISSGGHTKSEMTMLAYNMRR